MAGDELPGDRLLQGVLSLRHEPSLAVGPLQLLTQQLVLRTLSRSLSATLPWEVDKLCASLQQQQAAVNQGLPATASAGVSEAAKPAGAPKRKGLAGLLRASWHDIQQVRLEACVEEREKELSASADQTPESGKLAALIEAKKLKLAGLQRELREEVLRDQLLMEGCSSPTQLLDWSRWRRPPASRHATFVPPRLPAAEFWRRLQKDPETARRARQQAMQQWAAQQTSQQAQRQQLGQRQSWKAHPAAAAVLQHLQQQQQRHQERQQQQQQQQRRQEQQRQRERDLVEEQEEQERRRQRTARMESLTLQQAQLQALEAKVQQLQARRRAADAAAAEEGVCPPSKRLRNDGGTEAARHGPVKSEPSDLAGRHAASCRGAGHALGEDTPGAGAALGSDTLQLLIGDRGAAQSAVPGSGMHRVAAGAARGEAGEPAVPQDPSHAGFHQQQDEEWEMGSMSEPGAAGMDRGQPGGDTTQSVKMLGPEQQAADSGSPGVAGTPNPEVPVDTAAAGEAAATVEGGWEEGGEAGGVAGSAGMQGAAVHDGIGGGVGSPAADWVEVRVQQVGEVPAWPPSEGLLDPNEAGPDPTSDPAAAMDDW
ncbi:hypothetical protein N2152v2_001238 [Parachlorella kessleri]